MSALTYCETEKQARRLVNQYRANDIDPLDFLQEIYLIARRLADSDVKGEMRIKVE